MVMVSLLSKAPARTLRQRSGSADAATTKRASRVSTSGPNRPSTHAEARDAGKRRDAQPGGREVRRRAAPSARTVQSAAGAAARAAAVQERGRLRGRAMPIPPSCRERSSHRAVAPRVSAPAPPASAASKRSAATRSSCGHAERSLPRVSMRSLELSEFHALSPFPSSLLPSLSRKARLARTSSASTPEMLVSRIAAASALLRPSS